MLDASRTAPGELGAVFLQQGYYNVAKRFEVVAPARYMGGGESSERLAASHLADWTIFCRNKTRKIDVFFNTGSITST